MQLQIKAQGLELSDPTRVYTEEKVGRLERYIEANHRESALADVHLLYAAAHTEDRKDECRITITGIGKGQSLHVAVEEPEMHVAIDAAVQTMEERLRRHHDKLRDHLTKEATEAKQPSVENLLDTEDAD